MQRQSDFSNGNGKSLYTTCSSIEYVLERKYVLCVHYKTLTISTYCQILQLKMFSLYILCQKPKLGNMLVEYQIHLDMRQLTIHMMLFADLI